MQLVFEREPGNDAFDGLCNLNEHLIYGDDYVCLSYENWPEVQC